MSNSMLYIPNILRGHSRKP